MPGIVWCLLGSQWKNLLKKPLQGCSYCAALAPHHHCWHAALGTLPDVSTHTLVLALEKGMDYTTFCHDSLWFFSYCEAVSLTMTMSCDLKKQRVRLLTWDSSQSLGARWFELRVQLLILSSIISKLIQPATWVTSDWNETAGVWWCPFIFSSRLNVCNCTFEWCSSPACFLHADPAHQDANVDSWL